MQDITESKQAEEKINYQANLLQDITEAVIASDTNLRIVSWNKAAEKMYGWRKDEVVGKDIDDVCKTEFVSVKQEEAQKQLIDTGEWKGEIIQKTKDGETIYVLASVSLLVDMQGNPMGGVTVNSDITERKQAEEALQESEEIFNQFMEHSPIYVFFKDADIRSLRLSKNYEQMLGRPIHELLGKNMDKLFPSDLAKNIIADDQLILSKGEPITIEEKFNGRFYVTTKFPIYLKGKPAHLAGYTIDITERKQAEEALRKSEQSIQKITDTIPCSIYQYQRFPDGTDRFLFVSHRSEELFGFPRERIEEDAGLAWSALHREDLDAFKESVAESTESLSLWEHDYRVQTEEGKIKWLHGNAIPELQDDGSIIWTGIVLDITERKQVEDALQESEKRYRSLVDQLPVGIAHTTLDGKIIYQNPHAQKMWGYSAQELSELNAKVFYVHPEDRNELVENLKAKSEHSFEYQLRRKDGRVFWGKGITTVVQDTRGNVIYQGILEDITDRKRMEEDLRRVQNLESLGLLAGGIAHDFNNVLTGVMGNLALLLRFLDKDSTEYEIAQEAQQAATKTKGLTQQLMTFAKGGAPIKESASIEALIRETTELSLHGANTKPEYHFADDLPSVDIDTGQMGQVIQNLVINADQAMPEGGILKISADNVEVSEEDPLPLEAGTYIRVSVEDQGVGISKSMLGKVLDPYFSTKESGHGLGLSISHSIIQRHNGHMSVRSEIDVGTTFTFYLPTSEKQAVVVDEQKKELSVGTGRILLMDDEETIHRMVGRTLKVLGYEVKSVYDGDEALRVYKEALGSDKPFNVVIMDLTIPGGMGGKEAVGKLHRIDPHARVIVSSGYAHDPVMANFADYGFSGSVAKPVDLEELADTVKRVLKLAEGEE